MKKDSNQPALNLKYHRLPLVAAPAASPVNQPCENCSVEDEITGGATKNAHQTHFIFEKRRSNVFVEFYAYGKFGEIFTIGIFSFSKLYDFLWIIIKTIIFCVLLMIIFSLKIQ